MNFEQVTANGITFYRAADLGANHGFSTRLGGVSSPPFDTLNLGLSQGDLPSCVRENFSRFCAAVGVHTERMVVTHQIHEDNVRVASSEDAGKGLDFPRNYDADGLITNEKNLPLVIHTADCIPILFYDPVHRAIGACHAGWRGTALGIAAKTARKMAESYGTDPKDLHCAIGPGISLCCFETRSDVPKAMYDALGSAAEAYVIDHRDGTFHVDLKGINRRWLQTAGVPAEQIAVCDACTVCHPELFFSHRRMGSARGAMAAVIELS